MQNNIEKFAALVQSYKAAKSQENQGKESANGLGAKIALMAAKAYRDNDEELKADIESKNWKKGDSEGAYYAIRGMLSKARTVAASDLVLTEDSSISALYDEAKKRQGENPKDTEKKAIKAALEHHGLTMKDYNAKTNAQQAMLIADGMAVLEAKNAKTLPPLDAKTMYQALLSFVQSHGETVLQQVLNDVNSALQEAAEAEAKAAA